MNTRTIVVGAGLSGLACAFDLSRAGRDVLVIEAGPRAGGVVGTVEQDGFRFETGPHTVQASSESFRVLCGDLGLGPRMFATGRAANTRWLWFQGRLVALPRSPLGLFSTPLLTGAGKRALLSEPFRRFTAPAADAPEPTFEEFLTERIGRESTRLLAGAFVRGVYAAEIGELGARSAFPRLWELASRHHGLMRGFVRGRKKRRKGEELPGPAVPGSALISFPRGLQEVVDALAQRLGPALRTSARVERVERHDGGFLVHVTGSGALFAHAVVLAVPAPAAARLLAGAIDDADAVATLERVRHARVTVVHLGFDARHGDAVALPAGFGYLVPPDAAARGSVAPRVLGTIFASNLFPDRAPVGGSSVACFYRGDDLERAGSAPDDEACARAACEDLQLAAALPARPRPATVLVRRWSDVIPRYEPGHDVRMRDLVARVEATAPGLVLAGSYTGGVALDAVVARGRAVARGLSRRGSRA